MLRVEPHLRQPSIMLMLKGKALLLLEQLQLSTCFCLPYCDLPL